MIDLHLSEDQRALHARARTLAAELLEPIAAAGEPGRVNRPLVRALGEHGLLSPDGASALELCLIREGLAEACPEAETAFALQGLGSQPIRLGGSEAVRERWLAPVGRGEAVAAFALTEPEAGSDPAALRLAAEPEGDGGWRLRGEKLWISNAPEADVYVVFARTSPSEGRGARGLTAFAVPGDAPGLSGEPRRLLDEHPIGSLALDDVPVTREQVVGEVDGGFRLAMQTLDLFRPSVGAGAVGMAAAALRLAAEHAVRRRTFGRTLAEHQAPAHALADVHARVEAARLMVHAAAAAHDAGRSDPAAAAMAKLLATEVAQQAVDLAVQLHGARALEHGHPLEGLYRKVRAPRIYEGASEIQREIIARSLLRPQGAP